MALTDVDRPSRSSSHATWEPPEGLVESLEVLYRPQVGRLADDWGLDLSDVVAAALRDWSPHRVCPCASGSTGLLSAVNRS